MTTVSEAIPKSRACTHVTHCTSAHTAMDARVFWRECRSLAAAGFKVDLVAPHGQDEVLEGVRVIAVSASQSRLSRALRTAPRVIRRALRERSDIYHLHDPELLLFAWILRLAGSTVIYDAHEDLPKQVLHKPWIPRPLRRLVSLVASALIWIGLRQVHGVVCATPGICLAARSRRCAVVHNYPETYLLGEAACERPYLRRGPVVAYVGAITEARGAREMVRSMDLLGDRLRARLLLVGSVWPEELLEELRDSEGWKATDFRGRVPPDEIPALLAEARVGLVLLHENPAYREPYATKMFEYMAAGVPFVASSHPIWVERLLSWGCALPADPTRPYEIADAVRWLLENPDEAEEMGRRGQEIAKSSFNWESEAEKLVRFYDSFSGGVSDE